MNTIVPSTIVFLHVLFTCLLTVSRAVDLKTEREILENILQHKNQNTIIRPPGNNASDPVAVETNVYIRHIGNIDEENREFTAQLTFRLKWRDSRLAYEKKYPKYDSYVTVLDHKSIWIPDVFFSNEKDGKFLDLLQPNTLVRIYPNGDILFSSRLHMKLSCAMNLKNFPMDEQSCPIVIASYGYTTEHLTFLWKPSDPVQVTKNLHLKKFVLTRFLTDYCTSKTNTGQYSCVKIELNFERDLRYYGIRIYCPFSMLLIISWIPFWLDSKETVGRILIWVGVLLSMMTLATSIQILLPHVTYTMAIDVWTGICWTFLFAVFLELAFVAQIIFKEEKGSVSSDSKLISPDSKLGKWFCQYSCVQRIDVISRIAYPVCFAIFNIIYWATYAT